jgi:glycosyltransferase involved in cell wall biosynthesis
MRIAVDLTFFTGTRGGMETYVRDLYRGLAELNPEADFSAITTSPAIGLVKEWFPGDVHGTRLGGMTSPGWAAAELLSAGRVARGLSVDLLHAPANIAPARCPLPTVLTLHDVNVFSVVAPPSVSGTATRVLMRLSFLAADAVITDSEWSATEIRHLLPSVDTPLTVIPPVGRRPSSAPEPQMPTAFDGPPVRPMLLTGGNRLPHKNWDGLLRALARIPVADRPLLVITGSGGKDDPLVPAVRSLGITGDVILAGWTTPGELEWLYENAALFVLPSRYEGFGLGVLEAMERGCPVLASDIAVLREVGGAAARYVNSSDPDVLAEGIRDLLHDTAGRARMSVAGLARAASFSWEASARSTWAVFESVLSSRD